MRIPTETELRRLRQDAIAAMVAAARGFPPQELALLIAMLSRVLAGITPPRFTIDRQ